MKIFDENGFRPGALLALLAITSLVLFLSMFAGNYIGPFLDTFFVNSRGGWTILIWSVVFFSAVAIIYLVLKYLRTKKVRWGGMLSLFKNKKLIIGLIILVLIIVGVIGIGFFVKNVVEKNRQDFANLQSQISRTQNALEKTEQDALKAQKSLATQIENQRKFSATTSGNSVSQLVSDWRPQVAKIICTNFASTAGGSGTIWSVDGIYRIYTNRHVLEGARYCTFTLPNNPTLYHVIEGPGIEHATNGLDLGRLNFSEPNESLKRINYHSICKNRALVGDKIVLLGYPTVGSSTDITATEGIISGYEDNYYITSAKMEHGNSGGAAILVKDNCFLGMPTFAVTGEIESLGRILDIRNF